MVWLTGERCLALFPSGTIVREPHHCESLTRRITTGITAAASVIDAGNQKKIHGSGTTTLIISNEEMNEIMKTVQALEDSNILLKGVTKTI